MQVSFFANTSVACNSCNKNNNFNKIEPLCKISLCKKQKLMADIGLSMCFGISTKHVINNKSCKCSNDMFALAINSYILAMQANFWTARMQNREMCKNIVEGKNNLSIAISNQKLWS